MLIEVTNNLQKSTTPRSTPPTLLATSAFSLMNAAPFQIKSHLSPNLAIILFVIFAVPTSILACTNATPIVHSKVDYCNSLYYNFKSQMTRLHQIQNSLTRAVITAPKSCHTTPCLRCLQCLRITERIENTKF